MVTLAFTHSWELLQYLLDLHQFVYRHLGDELLWATSMPCAIERDADIPLAQYGSSHVGRMKTVYRNGLGLRYGRMMQAISGVHFNYSFPLPFWEAYRAMRGAREPGAQFMSASYFELLRNYRRHGWLVLYLFGVSPVVCKSFLRGRELRLTDFGPGTAYEPYATSLRMSDVGYRNPNQAGLDQNHLTVARRGREPGLALWREGSAVPLREWARELLDSMTGICEILDRGDAARPYSHALAVQVAKVEDVALTPSARLMAELAGGESFFDLALRTSAAHKAYFLDLYPP